MSTYYVATTGSDSNPGTINQPWLTIGFGVEQLVAGDLLYIRGGLYHGAANRITDQLLTIASGASWVNAITIAGYPGEAAVIQHPSGTDGIHLREASHAYLIFKDLTIDGSLGTSSVVSAIVMLENDQNHIRFERVIIKNAWYSGVNHYSSTGNCEWINVTVFNCGRQPDHDEAAGVAGTSGDGFYVHSNNNLFEGLHIYGCHGYGFYFNGDNNILRRSRIHDNGTTILGPGQSLGVNYGVDIGAGVYPSSDGNLVYDNLIYRNRGGIQVYTHSSNTGIYHNTLWGNGPSPAVAVQYIDGDVTLRNNIFWENTDNTIRDYPSHAGSIIQDATNIYTDPLFVNAAAGDFRLLAGSPAIDAGATIGGITNDFDGMERTVGAAPDSGAFEWGSTTPVDDAVPSPGSSFSLISGGGSWTTPATFFHDTGQASGTPYNPSTTNALVSENVLAWIACGLGDGEIHEAYGSDGAEGEEPKRRLIGWNEGTIIGPESTGWMHAERYRIVGGIQQYGFYARGLPLKHHRSGDVTFAWNGCGPSDVDGLLINQVFRELLVFLNEVVELNDGEGYRSGTYGQAPIELFADGTPKFKTSKFEEAQDQTVTWLTPGSPGALGYVGTIVVTEPTPLAEVIRRFFSDYGGHLTANHRGQVYPFLINPEPADGAGRLYRERMEIARLVDHRFAKEERENRIIYSYDYNFDTQAFRNLTITTEDAASITAAGGERIGVFATSPKTCYFANDKDTIEDRWARHLTLYAYSPRYVQWATHLKSLADANGDPARFSHRKEGLGLTGETGSPGVILHTTETEHPPEVLQTAMIFRAAAITAANLVADDTGTPLTTEDGSEFLLVDGA